MLGLCPSAESVQDVPPSPNCAPSDQWRPRTTPAAVGGCSSFGCWRVRISTVEYSLRRSFPIVLWSVNHRNNGGVRYLVVDPVLLVLTKYQRVRVRPRAFPSPHTSAPFVLSLFSCVPFPQPSNGALTSFILTTCRRPAKGSSTPSFLSSPCHQCLSKWSHLLY